MIILGNGSRTLCQSMILLKIEDQQMWFHILEGASNAILGTSGLKKLKATINYDSDLMILKEKEFPLITEYNALKPQQLSMIHETRFPGITQDSHIIPARCEKLIPVHIPGLNHVFTNNLSVIESIPDSYMVARSIQETTSRATAAILNNTEEPIHIKPGEMVCSMRILTKDAEVINSMDGYRIKSKFKQIIEQRFGKFSSFGVEYSATP